MMPSDKGKASGNSPASQAAKAAAERSKAPTAAASQAAKAAAERSKASVAAASQAARKEAKRSGVEAGKKISVEHKQPSARRESTIKENTKGPKFLPERTKAVRDARKLEVKLIRLTGEGTHDWTPQQKKQILRWESEKGKWPSKHVGHHIHDVAHHNQRMAKDPDNIRFEHEKYHQRIIHKTHGPTSGKLLDRRAMIEQNQLRIPGVPWN